MVVKLLLFMSVTRSPSVLAFRCPTMCAGPLIVTFYFFTISTLSFRNTAAYPASQNWPAKRRDLYARSGNRWDFLTVLGRLFCFKDAEADDLIVAPVGVPTCWIGEFLLTSVTGASAWRVLAEQPVSITA